MNTRAEALSQQVIISGFMAGVYKWMTIAMSLTAIVAWKASTSEAYLTYLTTHTGVFIFLVIAQLGLVVWLSAGIQRMSFNTAVFSFLAYAALTGLTLSTIFVVYTAASIAQAFWVTAGMFGAMSLYGYTTKRDLSAWGSFLFMSLIGIIIGSVLNIWLNSALIEWVVTFGGIVVFSGLAAYDNQKLKQYALMGQGNLMIHGALRLYLDFINLFLMILRVMGGGRD